MAQAKFEINRDLYKELNLADARLKSTIDLFEKKEMSSQERLFFKIPRLQSFNECLVFCFPNGHGIGDIY